MVVETERLFLREMNEDDYDALYPVLADSDLMQHYPYTFDEKRVRGCEYPDEANGITHMSVISKEDWLREIGAECNIQQKEGLRDGI